MSSNIARVNREAQLVEDSSYKGKKKWTHHSHTLILTLGAQTSLKTQNRMCNLLTFSSHPRALQGRVIHWQCVKQPLLAMADGTVGKVLAAMDSMYLELLIFWLFLCRASHEHSARQILCTCLQNQTGQERRSSKNLEGGDQEKKKWSGMIQTGIVQHSLCIATADVGELHKWGLTSQKRGEGARTPKAVKLSS